MPEREIKARWHRLVCCFPLPALTTYPAMSEPDESEQTGSAWGTETYGDRASDSLTSHQLNAGQYRTLLARVDEYLSTDGRQRTAFVQEVILMFDIS